MTTGEHPNQQNEKGAVKAAIQTHLLELHKKTVEQAIAIFAGYQVYIKDETRLRDYLARYVDTTDYSVAGGYVYINITQEEWSRRVTEANGHNGHQVAPYVTPVDSRSARQRRTENLGPEHTSVHNPNPGHTRPNSLERE